MKKLKKNVTIITGGGKGIGFGLAQAFAAEGSDLVITGRTESRLIEAKERLEAEFGIKVLPIVADGADEDAIRNVVEDLVNGCVEPTVKFVNDVKFLYVTLMLNVASIV